MLCCGPRFGDTDLQTLVWSLDWGDRLPRLSLAPLVGDTASRASPSPLELRIQTPTGMSGFHFQGRGGGGGSIEPPQKGGGGWEKGSIYRHH